MVTLKQLETLNIMLAAEGSPRPGFASALVLYVVYYYHREHHASIAMS